MEEGPLKAIVTVQPWVIQWQAGSRGGVVGFITKRNGKSLRRALILKRPLWPLSGKWMVGLVGKDQKQKYKRSGE